MGGRGGGGESTLSWDETVWGEKDLKRKDLLLL